MDGLHNREKRIDATDRPILYARECVRAGVHWLKNGRLHDSILAATANCMLYKLHEDGLERRVSITTDLCYTRPTVNNSKDLNG